MKLHLSDSSRAGFVGAALLTISAYAVFGFQHGFEEQVGWYLTLLPGAVVAAAISDIIRKTTPGAGRVAFWGLLIGLNFLWYFGISLVAIKGYRFVSNASKSP
jgi:hypothetical protein